MRYASVGSVSHGTLRTEDLLESFADELAYQLKRQPARFKRRTHRKLINEARGIDPDDMGDVGGGVVHDLIEALSEFAPPYFYFGAHAGDGSDFGYWLDDQWQECFDGIVVDDTQRGYSAEVPRDYRGEVMHVSDHGNLTLYVQGARGKRREIWGVV